MPYGQLARTFGKNSPSSSHVVADVLDEHGDLGVETLVARIHVGEFGEHPLDDVVFLETLEGDVLGVRHRRPGDRIEHLLLDGGVNGSSSMIRSTI